MIRLLLLAAVLVGHPAFGQSAHDPLPALYNIRGRNDPLIARDWPSATGFRVGEVAADEGPVEVLVVEPGLGWAMVNVGERTGWLRLSALRRRPGQWEDFALPAELSCFGNEPGWSLDVTNATATLRGLAEPEIGFSDLIRDRAQGRADRWSLHGTADEGRMTAVIARGFCKDGISDREYRLSADLILRADGGAPIHYSGCCSVAP